MEGLDIGEKMAKEGLLARIVREKIESVGVDGKIIKKYYNQPTMMAIRDHAYGNNSSIHYVSTFKSIWDPFMLQYAISSEEINGRPPILMMKNFTSGIGFMRNIVQRQLLNNERVMTLTEKSRKKSAIELKEKLEDVIDRNESLLMFPERSRSTTGNINDFSPALFQTQIDSSRNKKITLIPVNIDYSRILEIDHLVNDSTYYALATFGLKNWKKVNFGNVYISFGRPIELHPYMDRGGLAKSMKEKCRELVKIQPINIVSEAINRINPYGGQQLKVYDDKSKTQLAESIDNVVNNLREHNYKFRNFDLLSPVTDILNNSGIKIRDGNIEVTQKLIRESQVYSNHIRHYLK